MSAPSQPNQREYSRNARNDTTSDVEAGNKRPNSRKRPRPASDHRDEYLGPFDRSVEAEQDDGTDDVGPVAADQKDIDHEAFRISPIITDQPRRPDAVPDDQDQTRLWREQSLVLYNSIARAYQTSFDLQTELYEKRAIARTKLSSIRRLLDAGVESMAHAIDSQSPEVDLSTSREALERMTASQREADTAYQRVEDVEQQLSRNGWELAEKLPQLLQLLADGIPGAHTGVEMTQVETSLPQGIIPATPTDLHPLQLEFYDKRADLRLLRDRLLNGGEDQKSSGSLRSVSNDQQQPDEQSPRYERYHTQYEATQRSFDRTKEELTQIWHQCQAEGLEVAPLSPELQPHPMLSGGDEEPPNDDEEADAIDFDLPPFLPRDERGQVHELFRSLRWENQTNTLVPSRERRNSFPDKREYIQDWMVTVDSNVDPELEPSIIPSQTNRAIRRWKSESALRTPKTKLDPAIDAALADDYVDVPLGGDEDPNCQHGFLTRTYYALRRWKSDKMLRTTITKWLDPA